MNHKSHEKIDRLLFGKAYPEVHKWLDATFGDTRKLDVSEYRHWITRHNLKALEDKYGDGIREFRVGCMHVVCDWLYHHDVWLLPDNEVEVIEKLKEYHFF